MLDIVQITRFFELVDGTRYATLWERLPNIADDYSQTIEEHGHKRIVFPPGRLVGLLNVLSTDAPSTQKYRDEALAFLRA